MVAFTRQRTPTGPVRYRRRRWWRYPNARREAAIAFLCLSPWLIGFIVFTAYPLIMSAYYSFTYYPDPGRAEVGGPGELPPASRRRTVLEVAAGHRDLLLRSRFPAGSSSATPSRCCSTRRSGGCATWRTIYFLPSLVPAIAAAFLWSWIFNGQYGLVNGALAKIGIDGPAWFGSEEWVLPAFIIMTLWGAGGGMILYLAALQQVPSSLYDAAEVDGANAWQRLIHITLPMTSPVILFNVHHRDHRVVPDLHGRLHHHRRRSEQRVRSFYVLYLYRHRLAGLPDGLRVRTGLGAGPTDRRP